MEYPFWGNRFYRFLLFSSLHSDEEGPSPAPDGPGPPSAFNLNSDTDEEESQESGAGEASSESPCQRTHPRDHDTLQGLGEGQWLCGLPCCNFPLTQQNRRDHTGGDMGGRGGDPQRTIPGRGCSLEGDHWALVPAPPYSYQPKPETKNHRMNQNKSLKEKKRRSGREEGEKRKKGSKR